MLPKLENSSAIKEKPPLHVFLRGSERIHTTCTSSGRFAANGARPKAETHAATPGRLQEPFRQRTFGACKRVLKKADSQRAQKSHDKSLANQKPRGRIRRRVMTCGSQPAHRSGRLPATPPLSGLRDEKPAPLFGKQYNRNVQKCKEVLAIFMREWYTFFILFNKGPASAFSADRLRDTPVPANSSGLSSPDKGSKESNKSARHSANPPNI